MSRFIVFAVGFVIVACQPTDPDFAIDFGEPDACGAEAVQDFVGQALSAANGVSAPGGVRRIGPGALVTTDLNPARMNITHDGTTITGIDCG